MRAAVVVAAAVAAVAAAAAAVAVAAVTPTTTLTMTKITTATTTETVTATTTIASFDLRTAAVPFHSMGNEREVKILILTTALTKRKKIYLHRIVKLMTKQKKVASATIPASPSLRNRKVWTAHIQMQTGMMTDMDQWPKKECELKLVGRLRHLISALDLRTQIRRKYRTQHSSAISTRIVYWATVRELRLQGIHLENLRAKPKYR
mmetsp:Transcript_15811/g.38966  ORF Transcript_15811/g.38966 Transcript_15811/m.38966 type:complete len:206 (+) Transcript_15811:394-1011(+)